MRCRFDPWAAQAEDWTHSYVFLRKNIPRIFVLFAKYKKWSLILGTKMKTIIKLGCILGCNYGQAEHQDMWRDPLTHTRYVYYALWEQRMQLNIEPCKVLFILCILFYGGTRVNLVEWLGKLRASELPISLPTHWEVFAQDVIACAKRKKARRNNSCVLPWFNFLNRPNSQKCGDIDCYQIAIN